jgi:hypothetical protein
MMKPQHHNHQLTHEPPPGVPGALLAEYLAYLDELREIGATNMFGARPYLQAEFSELRHRPALASAVLGYWMKTFSARSVVK